MGLVETVAAGARRLTFLGTGTSTGVPMLGCSCTVCTSTDPRNHRTRCSALVNLPGGRLLIDTSPEMRLQLLKAGVGFAHAVAFTHYHADHLFGLDDARLFSKYLDGPLPVYCEPETERVIRSVFGYAFDNPALWMVGGVPLFQFEPIRPGEPFQTLGQSILPIRLEHGPFAVLGFRFDDLAYCTDVNRIPPESWPLLQGLDTLILDALRPKPHPTHFSLNEALAVIERLKPRRAYLTHLSHTLEHAATETTLPPGVALAYDGLTLEF